MEYLAAGHNHLEVRGGREEFGHLRSCRYYLLEVIDEEQAFLTGQVALQVLEEWLAGALLNP
jgi:hypothetical protein